MKNLFYLVLLTPFLMASSCEDDDLVISAGEYEDAVFVLNQGTFGSGSGTVDAYLPTGDSVVSSAFERVNSRPVGNIVQSMAIVDGRGYIMVNNAAKAEVVNANTLTSLATITDLSQPRYMLPVTSDKGYISQWGDGFTGAIKVIDLNTNTVTATLDTRSGAERMVNADGNVFVTHTGGFGRDSVVTVWDAATDTLINTIVVGDSPNGIIRAGADNFWVLCGGFFDFTDPTLSTPSSLVRMDLDGNILADIELPAQGAGNLAVSPDGTRLYFTLGGNVHAHLTEGSTPFDATPLITRSFYGLGVDPATGNIYGADAGDFTSAGRVYIYTDTGVPVSDFEAGIIPGNFAFNR